MKLKDVVLLLLFVLTPVAAYSQDVVAGISAAFREGDSVRLEQMMSDKVQVVLDGRQQMLSREDAGKRMVLFFKENHPEDFSILHQSQKGVSQYMIGRLSTADGDFRVYCLISTDKNKITQIRIERL